MKGSLAVLGARSWLNCQRLDLRDAAKKINAICSQRIEMLLLFQRFAARKRFVHD